MAARRQKLIPAAALGHAKVSASSEALLKHGMSPQAQSVRSGHGGSLMVKLMVSDARRRDETKGLDAAIDAGTVV